MLKQPIFQLEEDFDYSKLKFYHGTSTALSSQMIRLRPPAHTGVIRDEGRTNFLDKVFFTTSLMSARRYAVKAADRFGGEPIVYEVKPIGDIWNVKDMEFVADEAMIVVPEVWYGR